MCRGTKQLKPCENETDQNGMDDIAPVSYFELVRNKLINRIERIEFPKLIFNSQFRYATTRDLILMVIGIICTFVRVLCWPCFIIVSAEFASLLGERSMENGTSAATYALHIFGGGKIL